MQLHNVPDQCLTQATGEVVGNTIGTLVQVADPEDDGEGGEFLRIRTVIDINKPLPRCCKLWSEGEHVGWALLKFERLPNFCYWCGKVTHGESDCDVWLRGKERLKKEEQQYGEWLRVEPVRHTRKTMVVVLGSARGKPSWKKGLAMERKQTTTNVPTNNGVHGSVLTKRCVKGNLQSEATFMEAKPSGVLASHHDILYRNVSSNIGGMSEGLNKSMESLVGQGQPTYTLPMQNQVCNKGGVGHSEGPNNIFSFGAAHTPLADITNRVAMQPLKSTKKNGQNYCVRLGKLIQVQVWRHQRVGDRSWKLWT